MNLTVNRVGPTKVELTIKAEASKLKEVKQSVLSELKKEVSAPGFRKGQAPLSVVEKQTDDTYLKNQVLDRALNQFYVEAISKEQLNPLSAPEVNVKKFVPYSELEVEISVEVAPEIKLPELSKIKAEKPKVSVSKEDVDEVIENLRKRLSEKKEVKRAAKEGDEVIVDFEGFDEDGKEVAGAKGTDYPLVLGSGTFIPGFEENVVGMEAGDKKSFEVTFPKDYAHKPLANAKVKFNITVKQVNEIELPEVNQEFVKKVGPFNNLDELRDDINTQLSHQKEQEANNVYADNIIFAIAKKTDFAIPQVLLNEQIDSLMMDLKQNLVYRGITIDEFLKQEDTTEEKYREEQLKPQAEKRVQAGLILSQVAKDNDLKVTDEEIDLRIQLMKGQYASDPQMQAQLETEAAQREVASRLLSEKSVELLRQKAGKK